MNPQRLLQHFDTISEAPGSVAKLRKLILDLAVRGKLVEQESKDEPASELLKKIGLEKKRLGLPNKSLPVAQDDLPFALPEGWQCSRIGDVCSKTGSGSTPRGGRNAYKASGIPFLRSQNIYDDGLRLNDVAFIDEATHARMSGTVVKPRDLLLNITGGSMGRCCLIPEHFDEANLSQHVAIIRLAVPQMAAFLHCLILSPYFQGFIFDEQTGAGRGGLPKNRMDRIVVALPPLAEQHRIVAKVNELMALCDKLQAAHDVREQQRDHLVAASLHRMTANEGDGFHLKHLRSLSTRHEHIKQLRQTILNLAVRGKLVAQDSKEGTASLSQSLAEKPPLDLPPSWSYSRLANLLAEDTRNGYSRRPDDEADGTPILRISAGTVRRDGIVAEQEHKLISGIDAQSRLQYGLRSGDLLACRFNGNKSFVGRLTIFNDYLGIGPIYPDKLIRVRVAPQLALPSFIQIAGGTDMVRGEVEDACATTVGNWGISASSLKQVRFPLPPLAEQHRIVAKVDELMALCDQLEASLASAEIDRTCLLDALLYEALSSVADNTHAGDGRPVNPAPVADALAVALH